MIARRIQHRSKAVLRVEQGSRNPASHRTELDGFIVSIGDDEEQLSSEVQYRPTPRGHKALAKETRGGTHLPAPSRQSCRRASAGLGRCFWLRPRSTLHRSTIASRARNAAGPATARRGLRCSGADAGGGARAGAAGVGQSDVDAGGEPDLFSFRAVEKVCAGLREAMGQIRRAELASPAVALLALGMAGDRCLYHR